MTNMLIESDLDSIENDYDLDFGRGSENQNADIEETYYPQFDKVLRNEASFMSKQYEMFYCLERSIRSLVSGLLESSEGSSWWKQEIIPPQIISEVNKRMLKEEESGITPRSTEPIDYTTFGELGEIMKKNWAIFGSVFNNQRAVEKVMFNLNTLRNPIAHCTKLADDEVLRLEISLRDWFRQME